MTTPEPNLPGRGAADRTPVHLRRIECAGFARQDGLYDIEATLVDTKPQPLELVNKVVPAGEPIHQMRLCITIDLQRRIVDAWARSEHTPYPECSQVEDNYRRLIGLKIEPGFVQQVKQLFRGTAGCSHMTELLPAMASTAFQVVWTDGGYKGVDVQGSPSRTSPLGGCHALRLDGQIVQTYFKDHLEDPIP